MLQANPDHIARTGMATALVAMCEAGHFPEIHYRCGAGRGVSYDQTYFVRNWSAFAKVVDRKLKEAGFVHGIHDTSTSRKYRTAVEIAIASTTPEDITQNVSTGPG